jgi:hypothetical protein
MIHLVWKLKTEAELHVDLYFQTFKNHIQISNTWVEEGGVGGWQRGGGEGAAAARVGKRCLDAHARKLPGCHRQCRQCQQVANKFERLAKALAVE